MELTELDITTNGVRLHVYRTQTGMPPLVFAHGLTDNGLCYAPIAERFADQFEIILYDSRNHGKSDASQTNTTLIERAHDLAGLVEALGLQRPGLIGHSMGAATVAVFAGTYPHLPGCIALEDPPPFELLAARDKQSLAANKIWHEKTRANKRKSRSDLLELSRLERPEWPETEREPWALAKQQFNLNAFAEEPLPIEIGKQIVSRITCPLLILTADPDFGGLYPFEMAEELVARLPAARHVHISGAGHSIRRGQPEAFVQAVLDFLEECAQR